MIFFYILFQEVLKTTEILHSFLTISEKQSYELYHSAGYIDENCVKKYS